jgi:hypothetical protein
MKHRIRHAYEDRSITDEPLTSQLRKTLARREDGAPVVTVYGEEHVVLEIYRA